MATFRKTAYVLFVFCLFVNLVVSHFDFKVRDFVSDCASSWSFPIFYFGIEHDKSLVVKKTRSSGFPARTDTN